jgi:hypothetical protein
MKLKKPAISILCLTALTLFSSCSRALERAPGPGFGFRIPGITKKISEEETAFAIACD